MSNIKKLFNQSSHYLVGQILLMAAGFISFPILTRMLSVGDYGVLGITTTTISIIVALAKLGVPSSIVRYYSEFKGEKGLSELYSTVFFGYGGISVMIAAVFYVVLRIVGNYLLIPDNIILFASIIVILTSLNVIVTSSIRAEQNTKLYNIIMIAIRYSALLTSLLALFFISRDIYGYYIGQLMAYAIMTSLIILYFGRRYKLSPSKFNGQIFTKTLRFGSYLSWSELIHLMLSYADRYMIQFIIGSSALGIYTAGYNLATYVVEIIMYPINYAIDPIYLGIYQNEGIEKTQAFLSKTLSYFLMFVVPVTFGFAAVGKDLLQLLATNKFVGAEAILFYVVAGNAIYATQVILNAGLFIKKKTHVMLRVKMASCLLNITLNYFLIRANGIVGAAQATLITYVFYTVLITYCSFKELSFRIEYGRILRYVFAAVIMFLLMQTVTTPFLTLSILLKILLGIIVYIVTIIGIDGTTRSQLSNLIDMYRKRCCDNN